MYTQKDPKGKPSQRRREDARGGAAHRQAQTRRRSQTQAGWSPAGDRNPAIGPQPVRGARNPGGNRRPSRIPPPKENWFLKKTYLGKGAAALVALFAVSLLTYMAASSAGLRTLREELDSLTGQVATALDTAEERERQLAFAQTEEYIEREARERYGFIRADEIRFLPDGSVQGGMVMPEAEPDWAAEMERRAAGEDTDGEGQMPETGGAGDRLELDAPAGDGTTG